MATAREQLAQFAAGSKALGRLCREYKNRSATVHLEELVGGALSFYAAAAVAESGGVHVFVAEDRDAAAYLLNDFYNLLDERQVYFFPSSWKRSAAYGAEDAQGVVQRTATMHAVRNFTGKGYLVVCTCPEALAERVADSSMLRLRAWISSTNPASTRCAAVSSTSSPIRRANPTDWISSATRSTRSGGSTFRASCRRTGWSAWRSSPT